MTAILLPLACFLVVAAVDAQPLLFSAAIAEGNISQIEQSVLFHTLSAGTPYGVLNHWCDAA